MNLDTNGAKAVAILVVLNAGLFISHHAPRIPFHGSAVQASVAANHNEMCKAQAQARMAATQARIQARVAAREVVRAQRTIQRDARHASVIAVQPMAPVSANNKPRTSVTDYVKCIVSSGMRSVNGGI